MQIASPLFENVPSLHTMHSEAPLPETVPSGQYLHSSVPASGANCPGGQSVQVDDPLSED